MASKEWQEKRSRNNWIK